MLSAFVAAGFSVPMIKTELANQVTHPSQRASQLDSQLLLLKSVKVLECHWHESDTCYSRDVQNVQSGEAGETMPHTTILKKKKKRLNG